MQLRNLQILCLINCASLSARVGLAQVPTTELSGTTGGGAYFKILVPEPWNGDLVIFNHGLDVSFHPDPGLGPLVALQLAEGFAVAASDFQQVGWALFKTKNDLQHLYNTFVDNFGAPTHVWLNGASLGGLVMAQAIEEANIGNVVGALSLCGAGAGSRNWDIALDLRLIYDAVCANTPTAAIPGGAEGLPAKSTISPDELGFRINECTGVLLPSASRTTQQSENLQQILSLTTLPESFLLDDMFFATFVMRDLVHDKGKLHGKIGTRNDTVTYDDEAIDATIERVSGNPGAENRLEKHFTPTGNVGTVKIISMHTSQDGLVVVENESEYAAVVPPSQLTTAIVAEAAPSHCGFNEGEVVASWESLRAWVAGSPQPTAASIQDVCEAFVPPLGGPCRIDPGFVIGNMDSRVPAR